MLRELNGLNGNALNSIINAESIIRLTGTAQALIQTYDAANNVEITPRQ